MEYEKYTKKELAEIIREMKAKLSEMKEIETQVTAVAQELSAPAVGVHKDKNGKYSLVKISYDVEKNAAAIESVESLNTHDYAILLFKAKQYLVDKILQKAKGGRYV